MRILMALFCLIFANVAAAAEPLRLRPARMIEIKCLQSGSLLSLRGSSDELTILRVGEATIHYEVYSDGFFRASCDAVSVTTP